MTTYSINYNGKPIWFTVMGKRLTWMDREATKKEYQPRFQSRLDKNHWMVFLDFDTLPETHATWELLAEHLKMFPVASFSTFSGKVKAVILVKADSMSTRKALDTVRSVVGELADHIDKNGLLDSFIKVQHFEGLQEWLANAEPVQAIEDNSYWRFNKNLPEVKGVSRVENAILKFAASWEKVGPVALPQEFVGRETGFTLTQIHRGIKSLLKKRMLVVVDPSFIPGRSAKTYEVLVPSLLCWISVRLQAIVFKTPPKEIEDGTWYSTIWACTNLFGDESAFVAWLECLPGLLRPGKHRFKRAVAAWKTHEKRRGVACHA